MVHEYTHLLAYNGDQISSVLCNELLFPLICFYNVADVIISINQLLSRKRLWES